MATRRTTALDFIGDHLPAHNVSQKRRLTRQPKASVPSVPRKLGRERCRDARNHLRYGRDEIQFI